MFEYKSGIGIDAHQLESGSQLILGGVLIPHELGLLGHSDGDVL
ncbi:MAG: 2-C-methyl-D-erythritol 2,4-cyclodiphosphate synthase, partial [SAR202 cluster bacterium]|nr:2-C-methyl-D-erythritol 2,4-cyclodiphosphate synthase [SAR202 cluster bacterium]